MAGVSNRCEGRQQAGTISVGKQELRSERRNLASGGIMKGSKPNISLKP